MRIKDLAKRLGVSEAFVRYHFKKWCQENGRKPREFLKKETVHLHGRDVIMDVYDLPSGAVEYITEKAQEKKAEEEETRKFFREIYRKQELWVHVIENHDKYFYRLKKGIEYGATPLTIDQLSHEELKEILDIAEKAGYKLCIRADGYLLEITLEEVVKE